MERVPHEPLEIGEPIDVLVGRKLLASTFAMTDVDGQKIAKERRPGD
jgi:hypothetical protein